LLKAIGNNIKLETSSKVCIRPQASGICSRSMYNIRQKVEGSSQ
jgi:hypothetical protein